MELSSRFLSRFDVVLLWCFLLLALLLASYKNFGTIFKTLDSLYVTFSMHVWRCHFYHPLFLLQWVLLCLQFWQIYSRRILKIMQLVLSPLDHFSGNDHFITSIYRKKTYNYDHYLNYKSNHDPRILSGVVKCLSSRATFFATLHYWTNN